METIIRGLSMYLFLLVVFRIAGKRTMSQATTFDLVLLLILSETTQQAMVNGDHSFTTGVLLVLTLVGADVLMSNMKQRYGRLEKWIDGVPLVLVENGQIHQERLAATRVNENDILSAARLSHGLERMDQIKYAVIEASGDISIIPAPGTGV